MGYGSFTHFFRLGVSVRRKGAASVATQIQQSAGGGYRILKRFNKPLKRFNTLSVIHPSLAENIEYFFCHSSERLLQRLLRASALLRREP